MMKIQKKVVRITNQSISFYESFEEITAVTRVDVSAGTSGRSQHLIDIQRCRRSGQAQYHSLC